MTLDDQYEAAHRLHREGKKQEAEAAYRQVLAASPNEPEILRQLAVLVGEQGRHAEALSFVKHALAIEPSHPGARVIYAGCLGNLGEHEACGEQLRTALTLAPDMPAARWNRALWLLLDGQWVDGWREYQWGRVTRDRRLRTLAPEWDGRPLPAASTLFLWAEQGLGDTLMFLRFVKQVREKLGAARLVLEVQDHLVNLLHDFPGVDEVITQQLDGGIPCRWTAHASLMSLPEILGVTPRNLCGAPYLSVDDTAATEASEKLRVGIVWAGNRDHPNDRNRSLDPALLAPLWEVPGVEWCSFGAALPGRDLNILPAQDWRQTARLLNGLDLLITVDTGIAHLAGALGRPVWILLPRVGDFRWGRDGGTTPWYDSAVLFRQQQPDEWGPVIEDVASVLTHKAEEQGFIREARLAAA